MHEGTRQGDLSELALIKNYNHTVLMYWIYVGIEPVFLELGGLQRPVGLRDFHTEDKNMSCSTMFRRLLQAPSLFRLTFCSPQAQGL